MYVLYLLVLKCNYVLVPNANATFQDKFNVPKVCSIATVVKFTKSNYIL